MVSNTSREKLQLTFIRSRFLIYILANLLSFNGYFIASFQFECCGVRGPSDYDGKIPISCCIASRSSCNAAELKEHEIYRDVSTFIQASFNGM